MYASQIFTGGILFFYLVGCTILALLMYKRNSNTSLHGVLAFLGVCIIGTAVLVYRLFRGVCTRRIKYYHLMLTSAALFMLILQILMIAGNYDSNTRVHIMPSYVFLGLLILQYVVGLFIFTYLYEHRILRMYWAPFHDIFGIWIFLCLVGICLIGINTDNRGTDMDDMFFTILLNSVVYISFLLVIFVLLCPHFEWELVGLI